MSALEQQQETQAVARRERDRAPLVMGNRGFDFDFDGAWRFARGLIDGGMVPKGITSPGAVVGLIEAGKELGLAPMYALANLTFTNGRLGIMGDAAKALIRRAGALEPGTDFEELYTGTPLTPEWTCTVSAHRIGQKKPFSRSFKFETALRAKLVRVFNNQAQSATRDGWGDKGPWANYTDRMMMYRALGFLVRDYFSDILGGAVLSEELRDYPTHEAERETAPPAEPDPLLVTAVPPEPIDDRQSTVVDAEVVTQKEEPTTTEADREAEFIRATEKLEGQIVSAESLSALDEVWSAAAKFVADCPPPIRKRLTKLYAQNAAGFNA